MVDKLEFVVAKLDVTVAKETSVLNKLEFVVDKLEFVVDKLDVTVAKETSVISSAVLRAIALSPRELLIYHIPSLFNKTLPAIEPPDSTSIPELFVKFGAPLLSVIILSFTTIFVVLI